MLNVSLLPLLVPTVSLRKSTKVCELSAFLPKDLTSLVPCDTTTLLFLKLPRLLLGRQFSA